MSRRKRTPVQRALIELRARLKVTQQQFSDLMHVTLPTIGVWETTEPPKTAALARLEMLARDKGLPKIAQVFKDALIEMKRAQDRKASDALDEIGRWQRIDADIKWLAEQAGKVEDTQLGDRMIDRLRKLNEVLAEAQRWSWRKR